MSTQQAKKFFHDWLDRQRPWAQADVQENVYLMMERIVDAAAQAFAGIDPPDSLAQRLRQREADLIALTDKMQHHPDSYHGPCCCDECKADAA